MSKALIAGIAGMIGSHIADHCLEAGMEVVGFDNLKTGSRLNIPQGCRFEYIDIATGDIHWAYSRYAPYDYIYHCAAYAAEVKSHECRAFTYHNNIVGSANLIQEAMNQGGCKRFVFISSAAVYGNHEEAMPKEPLAKEYGHISVACDPYGISKLATENDLRISGLSYTIFRAHNVYGPRQNMNDPDRNVVAIFMKQCLEGKPMTIYGDGSQRRQFSYIDDVAPYIAQAPLNLGSENRTFNIGNDEDSEILDIASLMDRQMRVSGGYATFLPSRKEVKCVRVSHEAFKEVFQPKPTIPLVEGIRRMAEWAKSK